MATRKATLEIRHDGIRTHATVLVDVGEPALRAASLDSVIEAALQHDASLADAYADILRGIADQVCVVIDREIDGSADAGCYWYVMHLCSTDGTFAQLTHRGHQLTRSEFPRPARANADRVHPAEELRILRRANEIGLGASRVSKARYSSVAHRMHALKAAQKS
jgi:hypothetical protein